MAYISTMKDPKTGERQYPRTILDAVMDKNGSSLTSILGAKDDKLSELGQKVGFDTEVHLSDISESDCSLGGNGVWIAGGNNTAAHKAINVVGYGSVTIVTSTYAFVGFVTEYKGAYKADDTIPYSSGTDRITLSANTVNTLDIPSDAKYIILVTVDGGGTTLVYDKVLLNAKKDSLSKQIQNLTNKVSDISNYTVGYNNTNIRAASGIVYGNITKDITSVDGVSINVTSETSGNRYGWDISSIPAGDIVRLFFDYSFDGIDNGNVFAPLGYTDIIYGDWENLIDVNGKSTKTDKGYVEVEFVKDERNIICLAASQYNNSGIINISNFKCEVRKTFSNTFKTIVDVSKILFQNDETKIIEVSTAEKGGVMADENDSRFGEIILTDADIFYTRIECEGYSTITLKKFKENYGYGDKSKTGIVFYDYNNNPISGHESRTNAPHNYYEDITINIPSNAVYLIFTGYLPSFPVTAALHKEIKVPERVSFNNIEYASILRNIPLNTNNVMFNTGISSVGGLLIVWEGRMMYNPKVYLGGSGKIKLSVGKGYSVSCESYDFSNINKVMPGFGKGLSVQWKSWMTEGSYVFNMDGSIVLFQIALEDRTSLITSVDELKSAILSLEIESFVSLDRPIINKGNNWVPYSGVPVQINNYAMMQKIMTNLRPIIGEASSQGGDIFNNYLFVGHSQGYMIDVYDFEHQEYIGQIEIQGKSANNHDHMNTMFFSDEYVESSDEFPILYSCSGYAVDGKSYLHGYRIMREDNVFSATLVHAVTLEFSTWTEVVYNKAARRWWIKHDNSWYEYDSIPYSSGDATINSETSYYHSFPVPTKESWETPSDQDHKFVNGKIYYTSGNGGNDVSFNVINTVTGLRETQIRLDTLGVTDEPEFTFLYKNELYIAYRTDIYKIKFKQG